MNTLVIVGLSLLVVILAGILGFTIGRWRRKGTVEAEAFFVRDAEGKLRAKLGMSEDGGVRLRLFDKAGVCCVSLGVTPANYGTLHLHDQQGVLRAALGVFPEEAGVGAVFNDVAERPRMTISVLDNGAADIRVLDEDRTIRWKSE
jgi:hypothetical protein